jgi:sugar lactone lactonase YvrE
VRTSHLKATAARAVAVVLVVSLAVAAAASAAATSFLGPLHSTTAVSSAVPAGGPAQGDINPYGVVVVPRTVGGLVRGDVLVSNFNDAKNEQGTGKSIVEISPSGHQRVFAVVPRPTSAPAVGLTTALAVLRSGFVVVGSLPAPGGHSARATAGALTILNSRGHAVMTVRGGDINGPWDMTAVDSGSHATLFVTNVLNGTVAARGHVVPRGTVVRITLALGGGAPRVTSNRVIATGFGEHTDPNALVVGPTGLGLGHGGVLYVADSVANRIAAIPGALTRTTVLGGGGTTVASGGALNDPLGLAIAPNGDIISANGGDGRLQETTPGGHVAAVKTLISNGGGDLFGLALAPGGSGLYYVDDAGSGPAANSLALLH